MEGDSILLDKCLFIKLFIIYQIIYLYSEVPNRRADRNKRAGLEKIPSCLLFY